jgi:RNA polymerase sigma factor (sigma-70 family)
VTQGREALLAELRSPTFAIAYRMLGSVAEAEDVVQETLLRVHRALDDGPPLASPRAFAATVATRLAIDDLRSARARRERYPGEWLPEPIVTDGEDDPARHAEMADSLSMAFLVLLERLSPEQRAVLLLRDVFDYGYGEIAGIVGKSEANVRQLAAEPAGTSRRSARGSRARASSATSWRGGSSRRPRRATSARSRRCWPTTSSCTATAAARRRRWPGRCAAARRWCERCWPGCAWAGATRARTSARSRSTARPAGSWWTAPAPCSA